MCRRKLHFLLIPPFERYKGHSANRGVFELLAKLDLLLVKTEEIMTPRVLNCWMERSESLHNYFAFNLTPPGSACDLRQQLKGALAGAEIGNVQTQVRINDPDKGHVGKVQSFCNHLRPDQNVDLAGAKISQDSSIILFALERVGIHSADASPWKQFGQSILDPFRAQTRIANGRVPAFRFRTNFRNAGLVSANVAAELLRLPMIGQRDAAVRAGCNVAALCALQ